MWRTGKISAARIAAASRPLQVNDIQLALAAGSRAARARNDPAMERFQATLNAIPADRDRVLQMLPALLENMGALRAARGTAASGIPGERDARIKIRIRQDQ